MAQVVEAAGGMVVPSDCDVAVVRDADVCVGVLLADAAEEEVVGREAEA